MRGQKQPYHPPIACGDQSFTQLGSAYPEAAVAKRSRDTPRRARQTCRTRVHVSAPTERAAREIERDLTLFHDKPHHCGGFFAQTAAHARPH
jgi:hypothetical protein